MQLFIFYALRWGYIQTGDIKNGKDGWRGIDFESLSAEMCDDWGESDRKITCAFREEDPFTSDESSFVDELDLVEPAAGPDTD